MAAIKGRGAPTNHTSTRFALPEKTQDGDWLGALVTIGGRDNDNRFHNRMRGQGVWADLLRNRFTRITRKFGLNEKRLSLRSDLFRRPQGAQLCLL